MTLAWDPAVNAAGYRLYSGTTSQVYTQQSDVGNATSTLVSNLIIGQTYFFAVTAYNMAGVESGLSNEVSYTGGAPTPTPTATPTPTPIPAPTPQSSVHITVQANRAGLSFTVDGATYTSAHTFSWKPGSSHTIATASPQSGGTGVRFIWNGWSDGGAISHTIAPTADKTCIAKFKIQYFLTTSADTGGTVTPSSGWKASGSSVKVTAKPSTGYNFTSWGGAGTGAFSGTTNPVSITMGGPISEKATFTHN